MAMFCYCDYLLITQDCAESERRCKQYNCGTHQQIRDYWDVWRQLMAIILKEN